MTLIIAIPRRLVAFLAALGLAAGLLLAWAVIARADTAAAPVANNGTLKIHEQGTPDGTVNNDPKVCVFNVEGFFLDPGQTGDLVFSVQGGDGPTGTPAGPFAFGPADANGFYATQYFNLDPGHYKATLTDAGGVEKAKSKVFKVTCEVEPSPSPSASVSESASPSPSVEPSGTASPSVEPSGATTESPGVGPNKVNRPGVSPAADRLATTGVQVTWFALLGLALLVGGFALLRAFRKEDAA